VNWNVLSDGPSVSLATRDTLLPGKTLAVNWALRLSERLPVDVWAFVDHPDLLWEIMAPWRSEELELLVCDNHIVEVVDLAPASSKIYSAVTPFLGEDRNAKGQRVLLPTIFVALGWLYRIGATHVRVFGADMQGTGTDLATYTTLQHKQEEDAGQAHRWKLERGGFAEAVRLFRADGRRLERFCRRRRHAHPEGKGTPEGPRPPGLEGQDDRRGHQDS
jgi:hypothetical protein